MPPGSLTARQPGPLTIRPPEVALLDADDHGVGAVEILDAICKQELDMLEKRVAYNEAVQNLVMDKLLTSPTFGKLPSTSIIPVKRPKSGN